MGVSADADHAGSWNQRKLIHKRAGEGEWTSPGGQRKEAALPTGARMGQPTRRNMQAEQVFLFNQSCVT